MTPGRKPLPRPGEYPHVGRYRLYDGAGPNRLRCRLCGRVVKRENQWRHFETEMKNALRFENGTASVRWRGAEEQLAVDVRFVLRARRSRKNRRHAQYQHATGGEPWRTKPK